MYVIRFFEISHLCFRISYDNTRDISRDIYAMAFYGIFHIYIPEYPKKISEISKKCDSSRYLIHVLEYPKKFQGCLTMGFFGISHSCLGLLYENPMDIYAMGFYKISHLCPEKSNGNSRNIYTILILWVITLLSWSILQKYQVYLLNEIFCDILWKSQGYLCLHVPGYYMQNPGILMH